MGIRINECQDIINSNPKIMYIDKWKVWDTYDFESYASKCFIDIMNNNYTKIKNKPYYIRNDVFQKIYGIESENSKVFYKLIPGDAIKNMDSLAVHLMMV